MMQVLSRRTKNNPVLIGEPGVGKTAIVEGLAQRIVNGDVPESLRDRELVALDIGQLLAGAKYPGRVRGAAQVGGEGADRERRASTSPSSTSCTPSSAPVRPKARWTRATCSSPRWRGASCTSIGATTLDEYRKHVEKDPALERRFQPVMVGEPSVDGHHRDSPRPQGEVRDPPRRPDHRQRHRRGGHAVATATSATGSCPTRPSTWSTRRPAGSGSRSTACPRRSTRSSGASSSSRSSARRCSRRRTSAARERRDGGRAGDRRRSGSGARRMKAQWQAEKEAIHGDAGAQGRAGGPAGRSGAGHAARATCSGRRSCATAAFPSWSGSWRRTSAGSHEVQKTAQLPEGGGGRRGHRRDRVQVDRHPGVQDDGGRARAADPAGGGARPGASWARRRR